MSPRVRKALVAAAAVAALAFTGCTSTGWVAEAPPAAGSQAELSTRDKARNVLFVVDEAGKALLAGSVSTVDGASLNGISYVAKGPDGTAGQPATIDFTADIKPQKVVRLDQESIFVEDPALVAGGLATVSFHLDTGDITLDVPVYSNEHEDFQAVWEANN